MGAILWDRGFEHDGEPVVMLVTGLSRRRGIRVQHLHNIEFKDMNVPVLCGRLLSCQKASMDPLPHCRKSATWCHQNDVGQCPPLQHSPYKHLSAVLESFPSFKANPYTLEPTRYANHKHIMSSTVVHVGSMTFSGVF